MRINPFIHENKEHFVKLADEFSSILHNRDAKFKINVYICLIKFECE